MVLESKSGFSIPLGNKMDRLDVSNEVKENVIKYLMKELPFYELVCVSRASNHPDDHYLYQVIAHKVTDNTWACWTCWNETTQSLNYGHYNLADERTARKICEEFYHRV